jgi:type I restriction enzyme S subunit
MSGVQLSPGLAAQTVWPVDRIKDHASKIGSGITPSGGAASYLDAGIPLLRSQNVHFDGLRLDDVAYIAEETHEEMSGTKLRARDVLLNITGASIGRCTFVPDGFGEGNVNQHVCIIRPAAKLNYKFLSYCLSAPWGQDQVFSSFTGASRQGLGQRDLGKIELPLPPPCRSNSASQGIWMRVARRLTRRWPPKDANSIPSIHFASPSSIARSRKV